MTRQVMPNTLRYIGDQGRRYTNFYITDPLCCPSRSSIMTGQLNHNNHVTGNSASTFHLDMNTTLQHYLHQAGYQTWISGKFLNGWQYTPGSPNPPDWDHFTVTRGGKHLRLDFNQDGKFYNYRRYADPLIEHQALTYLADTESSDAQPWFGYLALTVPHGPYTPMTPYKHLPAARAPTDPVGARAEHLGQVARLRAACEVRVRDEDLAGAARMLRQADDIVGRVIAQLKSQNELQNTIIVFLSDNGFLFRAHQLYGKRLPYTESVKVPAMIRWSGHIPAGSVWKRPVTNVDLAPTLLQRRRRGSVSGTAVRRPQHLRRHHAPPRGAAGAVARTGPQQPGLAADLGIAAVTHLAVHRVLRRERRRLVPRVLQPHPRSVGAAQHHRRNAGTGQPAHRRPASTAGGRPDVRRRRLSVARARWSMGRTGIEPVTLGLKVPCSTS